MPSVVISVSSRTMAGSNSAGLKGAQNRPHPRPSRATRNLPKLSPVSDVSPLATFSQVHIGCEFGPLQSPFASTRTVWGSIPCSVACCTKCSGCEHAGRAWPAEAAPRRVRSFRYWESHLSASALPAPAVCVACNEWSDEVRRSLARLLSRLPAARAPPVNWSQGSNKMLNGCPGKLANVSTSLHKSWFHTRMEATQAVQG